MHFQDAFAQHSQIIKKFLISLGISNQYTKILGTIDLPLIQSLF